MVRIWDWKPGSIPRNRLIVDTYKKGQAKYGQTIVFAVDVNHAIALNTQFRKAGIASDYVVSSIRDAATGVTISREDNERKEQAYRDGKLQVLINVKPARFFWPVRRSLPS